MKKTTLLVMVLVMLLLATPAFAGPKEPVGDPIELFCDGGEPYCQGTREFPAHTPFHISHGWLLFPTWGDQPGEFTFELELDGTIVSQHTSIAGRRSRSGALCSADRGSTTTPTG